MENFWTDTPFGITLLASLCLTLIASFVLTAAQVIRSRRTRQRIDEDHWHRFAVYLPSYGAAMIVVTYGAILVYYIAGGVLDLIEGKYSLSFNYLVWTAVQIWSLGVWLGTAILIFRRMFRRWL